MTRYTLFLLTILFPAVAMAQLERQRVVADGPVENTFFSTRHALTPTVETIARQELLFSIMHVFGPLDAGYEQFWGLDTYANIRLGFDYGLNDRTSIGIARSRTDKLIELRLKHILTRQTESGSVPMSVGITAGTGWNTSPGLSRPFGDRLSFFGSVLAARKVTDAVSIQLSPTVSHLNLVAGDEQNTAISVGIAARYRTSANRAVALEASPVLVGRSDAHSTHWAVSYDMETGGHVFQLFLSVGDGLVEPYWIQKTRTPGLRFGFNVNRIFHIGDRY
jgi:hypothetical protein